MAITLCTLTHILCVDDDTTFYLDWLPHAELNFDPTLVNLIGL